MSRKDRLKEWAPKLETEQIRNLLVDLVDDAIDGEEISFWDDVLNPYWSNTGDPLIEGQQIWVDDELPEDPEGI